MDFQKFLTQIRSGYDYDGQIAHVETIPSRESQFASVPGELHPSVNKALDQLGITDL